MKILAIDCAEGNHLVVINENEVYEKLPLASEKKSDDVLLFAEKLLKEAGVKFDELDAIAVCFGPGSWTGLRVATALTKGLAITREIKIVPFTSFEAISYNKNKDKTIFVLNGFGSFFWTNYNYQMKCEEGKEILKKVAEHGLIVCCKSDVAQKLGLATFEELKKDIAAICKQKFLNKEFVSVDELEPLYLRASQAEIEREQRLKNENRN